MSTGSGDKTQAPTRKRLAEARKSGIFASSSLLTTGFGLLSLAVLLYLAVDSVVPLLKSEFSGFLAASTKDVGIGLVDSLVSAIGFVLTVSLIVCGLVWVVTLLIQFLQVSSNFAVTAPGFGRKPPFGSGSGSVLRVLIGTIIAVTAVSGFLMFFYLFFLDSIAGLTTFEPGQGGRLSLTLLSFCLAIFGMMLVTFGVLDYLASWLLVSRSLRMSREEISAESKDDEISPLVKSRISERRRSLREGNIVKIVQNSTAVISGPDVAVTLSYDPETGNAPAITGAGKELNAVRMKSLASTHKIPTIKDGNLARILFEIGAGGQVPEKYFESVARAFRIAGIGF